MSYTYNNKEMCSIKIIRFYRNVIYGGLVIIRLLSPYNYLNN